MGTDRATTVAVKPCEENALMSADKTPTDAQTAAKVDRITRDLLEQLELQTRVVLNLLERAPEGQREALLARFAELRGRLVRLRTLVLGGSRPKLVRAARRDGGGEAA
jgi:hypothetical protein